MLTIGNFYSDGELIIENITVDLDSPEMDGSWPYYNSISDLSNLKIRVLFPHKLMSEIDEKNLEFRDDEGNRLELSLNRSSIMNEAIFNVDKCSYTRRLIASSYIYNSGFTTDIYFDKMLSKNGSKFEFNGKEIEIIGKSDNLESKPFKKKRYYSILSKDELKENEIETIFLMLSTCSQHRLFIREILFLDQRILDIRGSRSRSSSHQNCILPISFKDLNTVRKNMDETVFIDVLYRYTEFASETDDASFRKLSLGRQLLESLNPSRRSVAMHEWIRGFIEPSQSEFFEHLLKINIARRQAQSPIDDGENLLMFNKLRNGREHNFCNVENVDDLNILDQNLICLNYVLRLCILNLHKISINIKNMNEYKIFDGHYLDMERELANKMNNFSWI